MYEDPLRTNLKLPIVAIDIRHYDDNEDILKKHLSLMPSCAGLFKHRGPRHMFNAKHFICRLS